MADHFNCLIYIADTGQFNHQSVGAFNLDKRFGYAEKINPPLNHIARPGHSIACALALDAGKVGLINKVCAAEKVKARPERRNFEKVRNFKLVFSSFKFSKVGSFVPSLWVNKKGQKDRDKNYNQWNIFARHKVYPVKSPVKFSLKEFHRGSAKGVI